jgi:lipopolysaccharide transport system ATP-binding protein
MMQTVHLDNVSKRFRLGASNEYGRITEAITGLFKQWVAPPRTPTGGGNGIRPTQIRDGWFWALEGLQLEVHQGEILGIVGRNGAGKSTLLKLLARIITPTTGRVGVRGRVGSLLEVGTGFHPELTGRENVYLNGSILGMSRRDIKARFDQIVDFAEIGPFLDTPVKRYSSGMAVRLAFAVAAYLEPDVLIVDEVLAVGDQAFQQKCILKARELGEQGRTVLLVSHNLASVANLCTRAVYLREGKLVLDGSPSSVIEEYLRSSVGASGVKRWEPQAAPKSTRLRVLEVSVQSTGDLGDAGGEVDIDRPIRISVEFEVLEGDSIVTVAIRLSDESAVNILWSTNASSMCQRPDPLYGKPLSAGIYRSVCTLPSNFLNDNRYFISVILGEKPGDSEIELDSVLSFVVHDTGAMRKEYAGNWSGPVVRPRLDWQSHPVDLMPPSGMNSRN